MRNAVSRPSWKASQPLALDPSATCVLESDGERAHLQKRGWTLQETTLSIRVIYYDKEGLCWQCREGIRQERVPAYLIAANDPLVPRRLFDAYAEDIMNIFTLWCDLIENFTLRNLTFEFDKLAAILGLASAVSAFIQSRLKGDLRQQRKKNCILPQNFQDIGLFPKLQNELGSTSMMGGMPASETC